jgi:lambda family phage minor tail protein L
MSQMAAQQQQLAPGARVELFMLDLTPLGYAVQYFFTSNEGVSFGGNVYTHVPVEMTDLERNASGERVSPKLSLQNTSKFASSLINQYDDLVGAEITRMVTYDKFLDGRPGADSTAIRELDIFVVEQKLSLNKVFAQWELRVLADTGDRVLPGRVVMKEICPFIYRRWNAALGAFVNSKVRPCPYASATVFAKVDNSTTTNPALDVCSNTIPGCKARTAGWPSGILGFGGYPGISRYRMS